MSLVATELARELRYLRRELVRINKRVALSHMEGPVAERDAQTWRVRIELGLDAEGNKILSPWVRVQSRGAGAVKDSLSLPAVGDKMRLISPSGVVGVSSVAIPNAFDEETTRPAGQDKDEIVCEFDKTRRAQSKEKLVSKTEKTTVTQEKEKITHATEQATLEQTKDGLSVKTEKTFSVETETASIKGKTTEIHGDSISQIKFVVGGQHFNIHPAAIVPAAQTS